MRVISGLYRHRNIEGPIDNPLIRPTKDRIREAIFSSLGDLNGLLVLDLYAGSGAMGIEAISRGAKKTYFVDNSIDAIGYIKKNLNNLSISNYELLFMDDVKALEKLEKDNICFDLVILDPPYFKDKYNKVLNIIMNGRLLSKNARIVVEREVNIDYSSFKINKIKEHKYGKIFVDVIYK